VAGVSTNLQVSADSPAAPAAPAAPAKRNPEATRQDILDAAVREFSHHGLAGGRIDRIADQTRTSKRMIYYYFGSKEELYQQALLASYRRIRETEAVLHLDRYEPVAGLQLLIRSTLQHFENNVDFVRLVLFENSYEVGAIHLMSDELRDLNRSALVVIDDLLVRGRAQGVFREGPDALDVHQVITALTFFRVSDRSSFHELFHRDMLGEADSPRVRALIEDTVLRMVLVDPEGAKRPLGEP
jgi:AcrR family transcriptional regulator